MSKYNKLLSIIMLVFINVRLPFAQGTNTVDSNSDAVDAAKALHANLYSIRNSNDWEIVLQFTPVTSFKRYAWLQTANPFGAQIQLCFTNGVPCNPKDSMVRQAFDLPFYTTVSNALHGVPWEVRTGQWPLGNTTFQTAAFSLKAAFDISFTNDVILQVTPLMYKENTNNQMAWLVNFPPIRVELKTDGTIEKLE
jgi:hypothetical protein